MKISSVASVIVKDSVLTEVRLPKYHSVLDNKSIQFFGVKELQKCTEASGAVCFLTLSLSAFWLFPSRLSRWLHWAVSVSPGFGKVYKPHAHAHKPL